MKYFYAAILILSASTIKVSQAQSLEFNTDGLYNAEFFDYIYRGHFENVEMKREDFEFLSIFEQYLRAFGRNCSNYLPADKVMIMNTVCAEKEEWVTRNGYGVEISRSSTCIRWKQVESGIYAQPDLYRAKEELSRIHDANALIKLVEYMSDQNPMGNSVDMVHKSKALLFDMARIFEINSCNSPGIRRFEENLKLFALNKSAIRMEGASKYVAMKESGGPTGLQDLNSLIDDLVADQAKTWMFNSYTPGSISDVEILSNDSQGRPATLKADYRYSGFSGKSGGWVKITFDNGLPKGIYFFDFPNNRKTPSSSIVASYAQGNYTEGEGTDKPAKTNCDQPLFIVDEMPTFEGGDVGLRESMRIEYPEELIGTGIQGKVYVSFVVGPDGQIMDVRISRGLHKILDQLTLERVRSLRFLTGGRQNGEPVCVSYTTPVNFKE